MVATAIVSGTATALLPIDFVDKALDNIAFNNLIITWLVTRQLDPAA